MAEFQSDDKPLAPTPRTDVEHIPEYFAKAGIAETLAAHHPVLLIRQMANEILRLERELAEALEIIRNSFGVSSSPSATAKPCSKCGKTPPFKGGTRCQDLQCPLINWASSASHEPTLVQPIIHNDHEWPILCADVSGATAIRWKAADGNYRWMLHAEAIAARQAVPSAIAKPTKSAIEAAQRTLNSRHDCNEDSVECAEEVLRLASFATDSTEAK